MYTGTRWLGGQVFDTKQYTSTQLASLNASAGTNFVKGDSAGASDHLPVFSIVRVGIKPEITAIVADNGTVAITYQALISTYVTYSLQQSTDLVHWTPATATNQTLNQTADTLTVQSTVNAGTGPLFFQVQATVN